MPDTPSIVIVKEFQYRGKAERWSNKYHFSGTTPGGDAAWKTLADAIIAQEKLIMHTGIKFVGALGYVAGDEHSVAQIDYTAPPNTPVTGTLNPTGQNLQAGDGAFWVRWRTPQRSSRGKWIYGRKYFHGAMASTDGDTLIAVQRNPAITYADKMIDGTLPGGFKVCGPQGAVYAAPLVSTYVTTRTLKRRGKRPS